MKKVLITGARGMLGADLAKQFQAHFEVFPFGREELDITQPKACIEVINRIQPDIICHAAAYTNVEQAEQDQTQCQLVNEQGTLNLLKASLPTTFFIYVSSTGIYGNYQDGPFSEADAVRPTTVYHCSKAEAEALVRQHQPQHLILRTGWLFGGNPSHAKNFVYKRIEEARQNQQIRSNPFQWGNPTYTQDFANQLLTLLEKGITGTFNVVNAGHASRYDYVAAIVKASGIECAVVKGNKADFNRIAPVSHNESATNQKLQHLQLDQMRDWRIALVEYVEVLKRASVV